jgi:hypothetical protein
MKNLKQTIEACNLAKLKNSIMDLSNGMVSVAFPGEFVYTAELDLAVSKPHVCFMIQSFLNVAPILSNDYTSNDVSDTLELSDNKGSRSLLSYRINKYPREHGFSGDYIGDLSIEDLEVIKRSLAYAPDQIEISKGFICITSRFTQTTVRSKSKLNRPIQIPPSVAKVICVEIMGQLSVFSYNSTIDIENIHANTAISFLDPMKASAERLIEVGQESIKIGRKELLLSLNAVGKSKKFNSRVHLMKHAPAADLQIDFLPGEIRLTNKFNNNVNVMFLDHGINRTILTYGGVLTRHVRELTSVNLDLLINAEKGLTINKEHTIASYNG